MSEIQKEACDEHDFAKAMKDVFLGMFFLTYVMRKIGVIIDHNKQYSQNEKCENIAKNNYDQRFNCFKEVMFPRYKEFQEYTLQFS